MTSEELRARLTDLATSGSAAPPDAWELTLAMLRPANLGHADPALRDDLIYRTLAAWVHAGVFSREQLGAILATVVDEDHLLFELGASDGASGLTRSFSVLQVAAVLSAHVKAASLAPARVTALVPVLERYLREERDLRGFHERHGWIHAMAHAADAVGNLSLCPELGREEVIDLLRALTAAAAREDHTYAHGEDERLAAAMAQALTRAELTTQDRLAWLGGFREPVHACAELGLPAGYARLVNVTHTLRALYFELRRARTADHEALASGAEELLRQFAQL